MTEILIGTFVDGAFVPDDPPALPPGSRVRLVVERLDDAPMSPPAAWQELERLCAESPIDSGGARLTRDALHERR